MRLRTFLIVSIGVLLSCQSEPPETNAPSDRPDLLEPRNTEALAFQHPEDCRTCHPQHVQEWEMTPHAYALKDPVFRAMVEMGQAATEGKLGQFCVQCHTPTGLATEQTPVVYNEDTLLFEQSLETDAIGQTGVTCTACHSMTNVVEPLNARVVYTPNGVMQGPISDPVDNDFHASAYNELFDESVEGFGRMCGSCHNVVNPKGALVEQTFNEFEASSAAANGKNCVTCHMPAYTGKAAEGPDAPLGVPERTLHRHTFVGVDVSLLPEGEFPGDAEMRMLVTELLQESAELSTAFVTSDGELRCRIRNLAGHAIPSGATAERQMWLEVIVRDDAGQVVFESGTLDENGDLRDGISKHNSAAGTDPSLAYFGQVMIAIDGFATMTDEEKLEARQEIDADCLPFGRGAIVEGSIGHPVEMPWQADWQCDDLIAADSGAQRSYDLSELRPGAYTAEVRLLFRSFPPFFLRLLEDEAGLDPAVKERVPIVEMESRSISFSK